MIIDNKLSWKDHISFVCRKVAHGFGVIIKVRKVLRSELLKFSIHSHIFTFHIVIKFGDLRINIFRTPIHFAEKDC